MRHDHGEVAHLPAGLDDAAEHVALRERPRVGHGLVAGGAEWFPAEPPGPFLRLNYSAENPTRFNEAGERLGNALRKLV